MAIVYQKSKGLTDAELHYCPGCNHGMSPWWSWACWTTPSACAP